MLVPRALSLPLALAVAALLGGCGAPQVAADCPACPDAAAPSLEHRGLLATNWLQTATEAHALQLQSFRDAIEALDDALADTTWTAAPDEQTGDFAALPPAVIVDVDETMLDNSAYQAWMIATGTSYSPDTWTAWCTTAAAMPVAGAADFVAAAESRGVTVFYVTNRDGACEAATVENLGAYGMATDAAHVVTRDESEAGSAKGVRRATIAQTHRILLMLGDNLGDFVDGYRGSPAERAERVAPFADFWGTRWFVIPNPTYGSFVDALTAGDADDLQQLRDALQSWDGEGPTP